MKAVLGLVSWLRISHHSIAPCPPQPGPLTSDSALSPLLSHCLGGDLNFLTNSWVFSITSPLPLSAPSALILAPDFLFGELSSSLLAPWLWLFASSFPSYNHGHEPPLRSFQPIPFGDLLPCQPLVCSVLLVCVSCSEFPHWVGQFLGCFAISFWTSHSQLLALMVSLSF